MRIQHNIPAMNAYRHYSNNTSALAKNLEKLSSGYKINRAGDDAAGLAISEKMRAQITGLEVAQKNAKDGISLVQTAEGALTEVHDMLNRMYSLAEQSANGTYDNEVDRKQLQKEVDSLKKEIDRISQATNFNGIKLLDGSLGNASSSAIVKVANPDSLNLADGVTINAPRDGDGKKASLDVTFLNENGTAFGAGDSVTFKVKDANGVEKSYTFNYDAATGAGADSANSATGKFTGATFADQMTSLANQISATNDFSEYAATVKTDEKGNAVGVTITAKSDAAVPNMTFVGGAGTGVIVKDTSVKVETSNYTPGADIQNPATQSTTQAIANLISPTAADADAAEIQPGAKVKFDFNVNGATMSITLTASKDGTGDKEFKIGDNISDTTVNLVNALTNARFDDDPSTIGIDESQIKFSDYFTAEANKDEAGASIGSVKLYATAGKAGNVNNVNAVTGATITSDAGTAKTFNTIAGTAGTAGTGTAAVADSTTFQFSNTFSNGDQVTLTGKLSDGRDFEVTLTAADTGSGADKTFTKGANASASVTGIENALKSSDCKVKVTDADGNTQEIAATEIFGTGKDFAVAVNGDKLTIANNKTGAAGIKGATAKFSNLQVKSAGKMSVTDATATAGQIPGVAENIITFDDPSKIENGTTIQIDGKKYEFVTDASRKSGDTNTIAVEVENLGDGATAKDLATALAKALNSSFDVDNNSGTYTASLAGSDANGKVFDISVTDSALVLKSQDTGSAAKAIDDIKMSYDSRDVTELQFTTTEESSASGGAATYKPQVKVGDTVTVNGKTYELTNGGRTKGETNTAVDISGLTDVKDIVQKLADTIEANDTTVMATVETTKDDGGVVNGASLKLTGKYQDGAEVQFKAPAVETPKTSKSLDLQIGDDAEEYNRMLVEIDAVNVKELGLEGLDISTQTAARESMAKIKDAINYVSNVRGTLGATQNRLDHTINNLSVMQENIQDAESTIRDVDVAKEMMAYTKNNILVQSAQAMLAQANQLPQGVLQLLQ